LLEKNREQYAEEIFVGKFPKTPLQALLLLFLCAMTGMLFSNLRKFISLRRKGDVIDYRFSLSNYLNMDWDVMLSQFISIVAALLCWWSVILPNYPSWDKYAELIFIIYGGAGSEVLNTLMSKAEKSVIQKIKDYSNENK
jgi:hypothetical protein